MQTIISETPTDKYFLSPMGWISVSLSQLCNFYKMPVDWHFKIKWMKEEHLSQKASRNQKNCINLYYSVLEKYCFNQVGNCF